MSNPLVESAAKDIHAQIRAQRLSGGDDEPEWDNLDEIVRESFRKIVVETAKRFGRKRKPDV